MLTSQDFKKLQEFFVTKDYFKDYFNEFKNDLFNRMDIMVGELKTIREEQIIGSYQRQNNTSRIDKIEHHLDLDIGGALTLRDSK